MNHNFYVWWAWLIVMLFNCLVGTFGWYCVRLISVQTSLGEKLALRPVDSQFLFFPLLTSPSLDSSLSSLLQVASILPASAFISTPFGASITRDLVGDSNLKDKPQNEDPFLCLGILGSWCSWLWNSYSTGSNWSRFCFTKYMTLTENIRGPGVIFFTFHKGCKEDILRS